MGKKHLKELTIVVGLIVALLLTNYIYFRSNTDRPAEMPEISIKTHTTYIPMFTELLVLSTKFILKPFK